MAGTSWVARRFPVRIGRSSDSALRFEEPGVWDEHLLLESDARRGFLLKAQPQALAQVNGQPVKEVFLRNGDLIEFGTVRVQFWLAQARQSRLRWGEVFAWGAILSVTLGQILLLYWLLR